MFISDDSNGTKEPFLLSAEELSYHIDGCAQNNRKSQKEIYTHFYGYAISVTSRYAGTDEDAMEIVNDGFLKVFKDIYRFKPAYLDTVASFRGWLRTIMVYTAIDHFRKTQKHQLTAEINESYMQAPEMKENGFEKLSHKELLAAVRLLTPAYRAVFNLFVIEGFTHEEIAGHLGVSVGTSKSNLLKARKQLQKILQHLNKNHQVNVV